MLYLLIKVWNSIHEAIYDAESGCLGQWPKHPDSVSAEQFLGRTFCAVVGGLGDPPCRCPPSLYPRIQ